MLVLWKKEHRFARQQSWYGVPRSTLQDRVSGRVELGCKPGKKPYLTIEEEEEVVSFLLKCAKIGYAHC